LVSVPFFRFIFFAEVFTRSITSSSSDSVATTSFFNFFAWTLFDIPLLKGDFSFVGLLLFVILSNCSSTFFESLASVNAFILEEAEVIFEGLF